MRGGEKEGGRERGRDIEMEGKKKKRRQEEEAGERYNRRSGQSHAVCRSSTENVIFVRMRGRTWSLTNMQTLRPVCTSKSDAVLLHPLAK
jgi:hypothetical protein